MIFRFLTFVLLILSISQNLKAQNDSINSQNSNKSDFPWFAAWHPRTARYCGGINYGAIWAHNKPVYHLAQSHPVQIFGEIHFRKLERLWCKNYRAASAGDRKSVV